MNIEANLGYKHASDGVKLPEYLVRMTHREVAGLGALTFEIGEQLCVTHALDSIESAIRTLNSITNDLSRQNQLDLAMKLALVVMNDAPKKDIESLALKYSNYGFFRND
jgi:hypothetical protein